MVLPDPGRADEQDVGGVVQEAEGGQIADELLVDAGLGGEVEVIEGHQALRSDRALDGHLRRERQRRQFQQHFDVCEFTDRGPGPVEDAATGVHLHGEPVHPGLGLLGSEAVGNRAPPALRGGVVGLLHHTLAVPAARGTDVHADAVELRDRGERRGDLPAGRVADRGHAVEAPPASGPAQLGYHLIEGLDQVREVLPLGQDRPPAARVRQGTDQQVSMLTDSPLSRWSWPFQPIELDLLARRVSDDRNIATLGGLARFAVRPRGMAAQGPRERGVAALVTQLDDLVEQRGRPRMRVIREPPAAVLQERCERIRRLCCHRADQPAGARSEPTSRAMGGCGVCDRSTLAATSGTCAAVGFPCPSSSSSLGIAVARSNSGENISVGAWPPLPAAALLVVLGLLLLTLLTAPSCHTEGAGVTEIGIQLTAGVVACFVTVAQTNRAGSREGWVNSPAGAITLPSRAAIPWAGWRACDAPSGTVRSRFALLSWRRREPARRDA
jgi:hypothetical protein